MTAELLVFSDSIIRAASDWNRRARQNPNVMPDRWPTLPRPYVYESLVARIGLVDGWVASALIGFYGNVLDLIELSSEAMQGRPTVGETTGTIARRLQVMASNLAAALDGLNPDRAFPIVGHDPATLFTPSGVTVANAGPEEPSLQALLLRMGGPAS
jgi:hypothetical protein